MKRRTRIGRMRDRENQRWARGAWAAAAAVSESPLTSSRS